MILLHRPQATKTLISIGGQLPPARGVDHIHDAFAQFVLGRDKQSRLFDAIRTKLRANYDVSADLGGYDWNTRMLYLSSEIKVVRSRMPTKHFASTE